MDPEKLELTAISQEYFDSLNESHKHLHLLREETAMSQTNIENDARLWYAGFTSAVHLFDPKAIVPPVEQVVKAIATNFTKKAKIAA